MPEIVKPDSAQARRLQNPVKLVRANSVRVKGATVFVTEDKVVVLESRLLPIGLLLRIERCQNTQYCRGQVDSATGLFGLGCSKRPR